MSEDDRLDLGALDPARDPARWRGFVDATLARADAALRERERRQGVLALIASWTRPVLAAAAVAVAILVPVELALERREARAEKARELAALSAEWARERAQPTGAELLRAIGEEGAP